MWPVLLALLGLTVPKGHEAVLFFVTNDCPISNAFAPEITRICSEYGPKGVDCSLVYVDPTISDAWPIPEDRRP